MKKILLIGLILLSASAVKADYLRTRDTVAKSSFSSVALDHVAISTHANTLKDITFSGVEATTVTVFNVQINAIGDTSTRTIVYFPGGALQNPVTVPVNMFNSSGTMILKTGAAYTQFNWDWFTTPQNSSGTAILSNPLGKNDGL